ncbi:DUF4406 domain-containing protein [Bacteroides uniformis]|uniref:DUF4406 domain-containing protein n=1 Tax=Bacteroides uniformis TaxID=820 RepID=A0A6I0LDQ2_BACUN|nr:DUF4406 domain-containing protein [Bacteroides uniformis]KAB4246620.1 DUF4406 domain-containing protein [Bacteroides uniformis]KAB4248358.1 DUF4406 domain-containing protein [Bacteroides uniformis]KAB4252387.1 DUF4406 domain-containing protein [Bacteroides uniformis]KAB4261337.1 DUF4406 domain-containing protein [Bacteroides uniformis]
MKKVYVSIPITEENYNDQSNHAFVVATNLFQKDYDVVTPFNVMQSLNIPYNVAIGKCIAALLNCDVIYLCKNWQKSKGCLAELQTALVYGKEVMVE